MRSYVPVVGFSLVVLLVACSSEESSAPLGGGAGGATGDGGSGAVGGATTGGAGGEAEQGGGGAQSSGGGGTGGAAGDPCCGPIGVDGSALSASGPIVLVTGQTVTGLHITNPDGPCIHGSGVSGVRITNNRIGPCGGGAEGVGVSLESVADVEIDHNSFESVASGLYALGSGSGEDGIVFHHNVVTEVLGPMPRGQMVQFNQVEGEGHEIVCNVSDQAIGGYGTGPEDHISMFASAGTAASPIVIRHNRLRGGGSESGGGIMTGDYGGAHILVQSNVLVDPGQYGIAIAGGQGIRLLDNVVFAAQNDWTNVGCYVWLQSEGECSGHEVRGNRVNYTNGDGVQNPFWNADNCGTVAGVDDNAWGDETVSAAAWDEPFADCP